VDGGYGTKLEGASARRSLKRYSLCHVRFPIYHNTIKNSSLKYSEERINSGLSSYIKLISQGIALARVQLH
jgi:hypothetical protein